MTKFLITLQGLDKLKAEIEYLKFTERPKVIEAIATARDLGDLSENAEYHTARDKQGMLEANIAKLEDILSRSEGIDVSKLSGDTVQFGATVKIENQDSGKKVTYIITSEYESDIDNGMISIESPIARALLNKKVGDQVEIQTPGGIKDYEILEVAFG
jgi:transcription elongation factor GreA